jgi:PAT family beta-lactamase induction signal transducer AmpG
MSAEKRNPWAWIPSLYFAEGLPYAVVMTVSIVMYKRMGISNADLALFTSLFGLPWVIKPLWGPVVDLVRTRRAWVLWTQLALGGALALLAISLQLPAFFAYSILLFFVMAFSSATHDIAADGFYMLGLSEHHQAAFVGVRSTFYRIAWLSGQGLFVILAGSLEATGTVAMAWTQVFALLALVMVLLFGYHRLILPIPQADRPAVGRPTLRATAAVFAEFFRRKEIGRTLLFLLFYRVAEAQLIKMVQPFLLDPRDRGGLGLSTGDVGFVYGGVGMVALTLGGLLGGYLVSRGGLRFWLWPMVVIMHLPDAVFVYLSHYQPESYITVSAAVALEQFGYGFGFTAYTMYMILVAEGVHKTSHFALATGIMALGLMVPGAVSGFIQQMLGYKMFFLWVLLWTIPGFIVVRLVTIPDSFGKRKNAS